MLLNQAPWRHSLLLPLTGTTRQPGTKRVGRERLRSLCSPHPTRAATPFSRASSLAISPNGPGIVKKFIQECALPYLASQQEGASGEAVGCHGLLHILYTIVRKPSIFRPRRLE
jgi:hypothetical protein